MPDATPLDPPETGPAVTPPTDVGDAFGLYPGAWMSLDGTTTAAEDGTWLAVGNQGDMWVVSQIATNPTFTQLGYLSEPATATEQTQLPADDDPTGVSPATPAQPPADPPGVGPAMPGKPGQAPPDPAAPHPRTPFGGAGGGLIVPYPDRLPIVVPIWNGLKWVVDPPNQPGGPRPPGYYEIPIGDGNYLQLRPDEDGGWSWRIAGVGGMPWLKLLGTGQAP